MSFIAIISSIELGLFYSIMTLGLFISYRILDVPDLTVDGSFTLGAAVAAVFTIMGHPILGIMVAALAGMLAGSVTAFLQTKLKIQPILAGILTMTALYSINLMIMGGKANLALNGEVTVFSLVSNLLGTPYDAMMVGIFMTVILAVIIVLFLYTGFGLAVRATGDNEAMVRSSSINVDVTKTIGLAIANGLVAVSGAFIAQNQSFTDVSMGIGMVVIGLASLIIGEVLFGKRNMTNHIIAVILGSVVYRFIIALALELNISASGMKIISAIIVTLAISYPVIKESRQLSMQKRRGGKNAQHTSSI